MRVLLIRKLANIIDGVDITSVSVGDTIDVCYEDACRLLAEGWAILNSAATVPCSSVSHRRGRSPEHAAGEE
jgi:hypothetical protein